MKVYDQLTILAPASPRIAVVTLDSRFHVWVAVHAPREYNARAMLSNEIDLKSAGIFIGRDQSIMEVSRSDTEVLSRPD